MAVLARVAPEVKLRIARALQSLGTDVARETADFVLLDDNFAHIVQAVEEGRAAFDNTRRFLTYHLTDNVAELTRSWPGRFPPAGSR